MRIGYVITNIHGQPIARVGQYTRGFSGAAEGTINQAEYLALIEAMRHAFRLGFTELDCIVDSQLLARQLSGEYRVRDPKLARLHREIDEIKRFFHAVSINWGPREGNAEADRLTHLTAFEEPSILVQRGSGRRPRKLPGWLAARVRRLVEAQLVDSGVSNVATLSRMLRLDITGVRQLLRGATYPQSLEAGMPDWDQWTGTLAGIDDATGWPDSEDVEEIVGDPYPYEDTAKDGAQ